MVESPSEPVVDLCAPPGDEACAGTNIDNTDKLCSWTLLGRTDSSLTDAERHWLSRYPCISREQLAELREAFLMFAVNSPFMTPRTAATVADSARLDVAYIGTCLRAVGQNPSQDDVARITSLAVAKYQQQQQEDVAGSPSKQVVEVVAKLPPAASAGPGLGPGTSKLLTAASDHPQGSRLNISQSPSTGIQITMDDFLCVVNAYGKLATEESQLDNLRLAFETLDNEKTGKVSSEQLREVLTTLGERLTDDDVDAMMGLLGDELIDNDDIQYERLIDILASV